MFCSIQFESLLKFATSPSFPVGDFAQIPVYSFLTVLPETQVEPTALNTYPDFRCFFRGVMTPSLMPAGTDVQRMLDHLH